MAAAQAQAAEAIRVLPPTITGALPPIVDNVEMGHARRERRESARNHTAAKRAAFDGIYARLVQEIDPAMSSDPRTDKKAGWKAVCAHRYCTREISDRRTHTLIEVATRRWLMGMRDLHFNAPADMQRRREAEERAEQERQARDARTRQEMAERLEREARARQEAEEIAARARAPAAAPAAAAAAAPMFVAPPDPLRFIGVRWAVLPQAEILRMLRGVSPDILNMVLQDVAPAMVSRIFEMLGLGESGEMCTVCMEARRDWSRFTRKCSHTYCLNCAISWAKASVQPDGLGCPFCVKEGVPKLQCIADPSTMFPPSTLRETPSLIPFSAAQIPLLQRAVDAEFSSSSMEDTPTAGRCPECSTVSAYGNDCIRRCHNPICAAEFCLRCNFVLAPTEQHSRHASGDCIKVAEEVSTLIKGEGLSPCPRCKTQIWHAMGHACHAVKCPACSLKFCHACGVPYDKLSEHTSMCPCPIFCRDDFACRCAKACPECASKACEHCNGTCPTCMARIMATPASS